MKVKKYIDVYLFVRYNDNIRWQGNMLIYINASLNILEKGLEIYLKKQYVN